MRKYLTTLVFINILTYSQWQFDVRLTNAPFSSNTSSNNARCIASSGDTVHAIWYDIRDGNNEIYYKRSVDKGLNWGTDIRLTNNLSSSTFPSICVSGSIVHVIWFDNREGNNEIYYKHSTDAGTSWGFDTRLTINISNSDTPSLANAGLYLHAVWVDNRDGNDEIYYKRSTDGGLSWDSDTRITTNISNSYYPSISISGSLVHVIWYDVRDGNNEIYYRRSTDAGITWGVETRLTNDNYSSTNPSIAAEGTLVFAVWSDSRDGNYEIYYKRSSDGGVNWGLDNRLTNNTSGSGHPSISVNGQFVHIVWQDDRDGNDEIYYKLSTNGGLNWGNDNRLTNAPNISWNPSISISGLPIHIIWQDNRDNDIEIYYKRNPIGNLQSPLEPTNLNALTASSSWINLNWIDNSVNETGFKIERSTNAGINWILKDSVSQNVINYSDSGLTSNTIYHYRIYSFNLAGNSGYSNIAFDTTFWPVGIVAINNELPIEYNLSQNFPNPFNPVTNISFVLPKETFVKLIVYDVLGKKVSVLVNQNLKAGSYKADWDANNYLSGVYFYKLESGDFSDSKKMILIK